MYKNETRYALINGVVLNGTQDMTPQTGKIVCVEGSRIAAVTDGPAPAGSRWIWRDGMCCRGSSTCTSTCRPPVSLKRSPPTPGSW